MRQTKVAACLVLGLGRTSFDSTSKTIARAIHGDKHAMVEVAICVVIFLGAIAWLIRDRLNNPRG